MGMFDGLAVKEEVETSPFDTLSPKEEDDNETLEMADPVAALITAAMLMIYASSGKSETVSELNDFPLIDEDDLAEYEINRFHFIHSIGRFHSWSTITSDESDDNENVFMNANLDIARWDIYNWNIKEEIIPCITEALNPRQRLIALANLCDIAMQDGVLTGAEKELLMLFNEEFEIAPSELNKIIEATSLKNDIKEFGELY